MHTKGNLPISLDQACMSMQAVITIKFTGLKKRGGEEAEIFT